MITRRSFVAAAPTLAAAQAIGSPGSDWATAAPESLGLRADVIADASTAGESLPGLRALLVAHRGTLVCERYYGGSDADTLQPINSATKSVCSMLVGLALQEGRLKSLDDTVAQLIPEAMAEVPDSAAGPVTLGQILSGQSGLAFDFAAFGQLAGAASTTRYALGRPGVPLSQPGWSYNDAMVSLIAPMLERAQGSTLAALAQRQLFEPLGIARFDWRRGRDGKPLAAAGLALRTRDLLKLAALMLERGRWNGRQVLPESWVDASLNPRTRATWGAGPVTDVGYGLLWFTGRIQGHRVAWAWGYGGQFALLAPQQNLAVATSATSPAPSALRAQTDGIMALVAKVLQAAP